MNVFISWSGGYSKAVAEVLKSWLKCVLQGTNPWLSTRDINRGSDWFSAIYGPAWRNARWYCLPYKGESGGTLDTV
jgi:hypothetical protein